jgi:hypothetical protein
MGITIIFLFDENAHLRKTIKIATPRKPPKEVKKSALSIPPNIA